MSCLGLFKSRTLVIGTKHRKELVIAPLVENALGVRCVVGHKIDTDIFGTFTGEVERTTDPLTTLRNKCLYTLQQTGYNLAIASEGSFGAHPSIPFLPANEEWLMLMDTKNNIEIFVREISTDTNFSSAGCKSLQQVKEFAKQVGFPTHGLILKPAEGVVTDMVKGIVTPEVLEAEGMRLLEKYGEVFAETDMRALYNPTRMRVIEKAAEKLVNKITSLCPQCNWPGFDVINYKTGLPCELCGTPTRSIISYTYGCTGCGYQKEALFPHQKEFESAGYCDVCNP